MKDTSNPAVTPVSSESATEHPSSASRRKKRELIYCGIGFVAGFVALPALIYAVGILVIGPYAGGKSLGAFYAEFYRNLGSGAARTWFIALAPYLAIWLIRLSFRRWGQSPSIPEASQSAPAAQNQPESRRREPFIGA